MGESAELGISERLRLFRESKKLTQAQMAAAVGGSTPGYKSNEQGTALPNSKLLIGLRELDLNVDWLLSGEGPMLRSDIGASSAANEEALKAYGDCLMLLEAALLRVNRTLAPEKKRIAVDSMYRAWARDKKIDPQLLDMITQLAA